MLIWFLNFVFDILRIVFSIAPWILVIYCVAKLVIPQNKYVLLAGKYLEVALAPIRGLLQRLFPKLANSGFDFALIGLWLAIIVAGWLIQLLRGILL